MHLKMHFAEDAAGRLPKGSVSQTTDANADLKRPASPDHTVHTGFSLRTSSHPQALGREIRERCRIWARTRNWRFPFGQEDKYRPHEINVMIMSSVSLSTSLGSHQESDFTDEEMGHPDSSWPLAISGQRRPWLPQCKASLQVWSLL